MSTSFTNSTALLAHRSFVRFWIARLTGGFANQMQSVAVGWQVYALTDSALDLGLVGLAQFLPSVVLLLVVGHVADRYDRRRVVGLCQLIEAGAAVTLAVLSIRGTITEYAIFALDAQGNISEWNTGAERVLGYPVEEILGKPGALIFTLEDLAKGGLVALLDFGAEDLGRLHMANVEPRVRARNRP